MSKWQLVPYHLLYPLLHDIRFSGDWISELLKKIVRTANILFPHWEWQSIIPLQDRTSWLTTDGCGLVKLVKRPVFQQKNPNNEIGTMTLMSFIGHTTCMADLLIRVKVKQREIPAERKWQSSAEAARQRPWLFSKMNINNMTSHNRSTEIRGITSIVPPSPTDIQRSGEGRIRRIEEHNLATHHAPLFKIHNGQWFPLCLLSVCCVKTWCAEL